MASTPLRAVFLDAGNTLLRMNYAAIAAALGDLGVTITADAVEQAEWRARVRLDDEHLPRAGTSTESSATGEAYLRYVLEELGLVDRRTLQAMAEWRACYNRPVGLFNTAEPAAEPALRLARDAGLRVAVISNSNGSVRSILRDLGLVSYLDFVLDSGEVGCEKPDPRIFRLALERAGVDAAEARYVGDLYSIDVRGARAAGIETVLLDPGGLRRCCDCQVAPDVLAAMRLLVGASTRAG